MAGSLLARRRGLPSDHRTLTKYNRPLPLRRYPQSCCPGSWICFSSTSRRSSKSSPPISCSSRSTSSQGVITLRKPCEYLSHGSAGSSLGRVDPPRIVMIQGGQVLHLHRLLLYRRALSSGFLLDARLLGIVCGCSASSAPMQTGLYGHRVERTLRIYARSGACTAGLLRRVRRRAGRSWARFWRARVQRPIVALLRIVLMTGPRGSAVRVGFARLSAKSSYTGW